MRSGRSARTLTGVRTDPVSAGSGHLSHMRDGSRTREGGAKWA